MSGENDVFLLVALSFAVFAAVTAVGSALVLGIGFERLRNGFENLRNGFDVVSKQTGFFSTAIHELDEKVEALETKHKKARKSAGESAAVVEKRPRKPKTIQTAQQQPHLVVHNNDEIRIM